MRIFEALRVLLNTGGTVRTGITEHDGDTKINDNQKLLFEGASSTYTGEISVDSSDLMTVKATNNNLKLQPGGQKAVIIGTDGAKPVASVAYRGGLYVEFGNPDVLYVCLKDATVGYSWVQVAAGA